MHELGVVFHCIKSVNNIAEENNVKRVNSVTIELGEVSQVIDYLFEDCWNWAIKREPVLKDSALKIEKIPAVTFCEGCGETYPTVQYGKICPMCGSERTYLVQGNELNIKEIEVFDE